jgi:outer membrane protein TolC
MLKRMHWRWAVGPLLFFFINGCTVNQTRDVKLYRDVLDAGISNSRAAFHPNDPLTLKQALELANAQNEQLAIAGEDYLQALIDKDRAYAAFLPKISFAPAFMREEKTALAAGNAFISEVVPNKTTDMPVVGNMNLHPIGDVASYKAAGSAARMERAMLLDYRALLMLDVARTYFQVLHSEKQLEVLTHSIKVGEQRLADVRVKQKAGVARPVDVALTEAQLAKTRTEFFRAKDDVISSRAMLAFLINAPELTGPLTNGWRVPSMDFQMEALLNHADQHRQDLMAAHERVKVAAALLEAAWGKYFPSVSLNLVHYISRASFPSDVDWTSLILVNVPIFSAGLIHADVRTAYSRLRQARLAETNIQRQVVKDLRSVTEDLLRDEQQIRQLGIQVKAEEEGMQLAETEFNAGLGTNLQRLIAQDGLMSAELALSTARFSYNVDYLRLMHMTGSLDPNLSTTLSSPATHFNELKK